MHYTASEICSILNLENNQKITDAPPIHYICIDTRNIIRPTPTLFIALPGNQKDGHDFIQQAYDKGVRHFITDRLVLLKEATIYKVENTLKALQKIATSYRNQFNIPIVSITGSNGKTTVKEWTSQLLSTQLKVHKSPLSYNSQIGVPLSIFGLQADHQTAILEAGISQVGEMKTLSDILNCDIGIFTTLGDAHSAGFDSDNNKLIEKLKLFASAHTIIYNQDQSNVDEIIKITFPRKNLITISLISDSADYFIYKFDHKIILKNNTKKYIIPFSNSYETGLKNIAMSIAAISALGVKIENILPHVADIAEIPMRMQLDHGINGSIIINDGYNADLQSFESALGYLQMHAGERTRKIVLSQFAELARSEHTNEILANLITNYKIQEVYAIGDSIKMMKNYLSDEIDFHHFKSAGSLLKSNILSAKAEDIILIKGARSFHLEDVHRHLSSKMHRTVLEIDLESLGHNLSSHAQLLNPKTKIMAMVKASAYGSGIKEISSFLDFKQVDYFGVAFIDEGVTLRKSGIFRPIMVLSPVIESYKLLLLHNIEPSINSISELIKLNTLLHQEQQSIGIHINIDTGMNRAGINPSEISELKAILTDSKHLNVLSIYSHLATADDPSFDSFTDQQIGLYKTIATEISDQLGYQPMRHILNSNGLIYHTEHQLDMVRLGIGLYGVQDIIIKKEQLIPVHTLKSYISHIQYVDKEESVGYGRSWIANRRSRIATIQIGYADGLPRRSGHEGFLISIDGQLAPIVGNVCMDLTMVDVTDIMNVDIGDEVIIFGKNRPISILADANGTIPYEILSNTSTRVKRIYLS